MSFENTDKFSMASHDVVQFLGREKCGPRMEPFLGSSLFDSPVSEQSWGVTYRSWAIRYEVSNGSKMLFNGTTSMSTAVTYAKFMRMIHQTVRSLLVLPRPCRWWQVCHFLAILPETRVVHREE